MRVFVHLIYLYPILFILLHLVIPQVFLGQFKWFFKCRLLQSLLPRSFSVGSRFQVSQLIRYLRLHLHGAD